jgi:hypothetical protein
VAQSYCRVIQPERTIGVGLLLCDTAGKDRWQKEHCRVTQAGRTVGTGSIVNLIQPGWTRGTVLLLCYTAKLDWRHWATNVCF